MPAVVAVLIVIALGGALIVKRSDGVRRVGTTVPDLVLQTESGETLSLGSGQTGPVVVNFWASSCSVCMAEMPELIAYAQRHPELTVVAVAMAYDPPARARAAAKRAGLTFPVVLDGDGLIDEAFGELPGTPVTFLVDRSGKVRYKRIGRIVFEDLEAASAKLGAG